MGNGKLKMKNFYGLLKKVLIILLVPFCLSANAADFQKIDYKNLKDGAKISTDGLNWTTKINKKSGKYFTKKVSDGSVKYSEFYSPEGVFLFSTGTEYEFIVNGSLIGYSNFDLKFYEFEMKDDILQERELLVDEVRALFPDYQIIKISDFSTATNSLKIKKARRGLKIILLNDTDRSFNNYGFSTNNSKFKSYELKGFLEIEKRGMIQFSRFGENLKNNPWFILLVR